MKTVKVPIIIGTQPIINCLPPGASGAKSPILMQPKAANANNGGLPEPSARSKSGLDDPQQVPLLHPKEEESYGVAQPSAPYPEDGKYYIALKKIEKSF